MSDQKSSRKAAISVCEMAELCQLSRSRFYELIHAGVFPSPAKNASCKRPVYDLDLQEKCLEIRQTGVGLNGQVIVFNKKRQGKAVGRKRVVTEPVSEVTNQVVEGVKSLGLTTVTIEQVNVAVEELFPSGTAGIDIGKIIRDVFVRLMQKK